MAAFNLKIGKQRVESDAPSIRIGTGAECALHLKDPVAATIHAEVLRSGDGFVVQDLGGATGTWLNGERVEGAQPLGDGDQLVVGCTRIRVGLDAASSQLSLEVDKESFFFEKSTRHKNESGEFTVRGDAERMVQDEVTFGRFRALRALSAFGLLLGFGFLGILGFDGGRDAVLQPGELYEAHASLFEGGHGADVDPRILECAESARKNGCASCHEPFGKTSATRCATCHEGVITPRHPFHGDPGPLSSALGVDFDESSCGACHMDHSGREPADGVFMPASEALSEWCVRCHDGLIDRKDISRRPEPLAEVEHEIPYDSFPHDKHGEMDCAVCHVRPTEPLAGERDYPVTSFASCMRCHSADDVPTPEVNAWGRDVAFLQDWPEDASQKVRLAWHGANADDLASSECAGCHAEVYQPALRQSEVRESRALMYDLTRHKHVHEFERNKTIEVASGGEKACIDCHKLGVSLFAGEEITRAFYHELHIGNVRPKGLGEKVDLTAECLDCHKGRPSSSALAGAAVRASYTGPEIEESCKECHKEKAGDGSEVCTVKAVNLDSILESQLPRQRNDFPHDVHLGSGAWLRVDGGPMTSGCFDCHEFDQAPSDAPYSAMAETLPEAKDCSACHQDHQNVAGYVEAPDGVNSLGCALCHPKGDKVWTGEKTVRTRVPTTGFSHWSRGHEELSSDPSSCAQCHPNTEDAHTVSDVEILPDTADICLDCHIEKQFHWRGKPASAITAAASEER